MYPPVHPVLFILFHLFCCKYLYFIIGIRQCFQRIVPLVQLPVYVMGKYIKDNGIISKK